jgi:palmitoyl transferase
MAFKDSHNNWEPIIGYGWEKGWYLDQNRDFRLGLGLTAAVTARQDFANYVPLPVVLPLLSASYKQASVQLTYIPVRIIMAMYFSPGSATAFNRKWITQKAQ